MKNLLFITTIYRVGERIYPIIPLLKNCVNMDMILTGQMSSTTKWYGTLDLRQIFKQQYSKYFDTIHEGPGLKLHGDISRPEYDNELLKLVKSIIDKYDIVIFDDCRDRGGFRQIYQLCKNRGKLVIANHHGNGDKNYVDESIGTVADYCFVFGYKEIIKYQNSRLVVGGIPANDILSNYKRTNKHIFMNVNFLKSQKGPFSVSFDESFIEQSGILDIQEKYNVPIVLSLKPRLDKPVSDRQLTEIRNMFPRSVSVSVFADVPNFDKIISDSILVLGAPSTLSFKSIQKCIPTILIKGMGAEGNLFDFVGLVDLDKGEILKTFEFQRNQDVKKTLNYIEHIVSGGSTFTSSLVYMEKLLKII